MGIRYNSKAALLEFVDAVTKLRVSEHFVLDPPECIRIRTGEKGNPAIG
jgi:hypothetical protein